MRRYVVAEFDEHAADVRPLGKCGRFLLENETREDDVAYFTTEADAERAIAAASNKRPGCKAEIIGRHKTAATA